MTPRVHTAPHTALSVPSPTQPGSTPVAHHESRKSNRPDLHAGEGTQRLRGKTGPQKRTAGSWNLP
jgi:hypothetical protein